MQNDLNMKQTLYLEMSKKKKKTNGYFSSLAFYDRLCKTFEMLLTQF